jgi:zona occludens toxin
MPVKAYIGLPRAGKTYEVVVNVILASLRQGRRVVSNIAGLNYDAMCQILYREGIAQENIGLLVLVDHSEVEKPSFWLTDQDDLSNLTTFIRPGDLLALDEIWRFWKKRGDIHPRAQNFFRMHGHMPDPQTGFVCEIALITQSTFQMVKNTKLGSSKSYIVHLFQRGSTSKGDFIRTLSPRFYNADYFVLYQSHSKKQEGGADALEKNPDNRGNILKGGLFTIGIPLALIFIALGIYGVMHFLSPKDIKKPPAAAASSDLKSPAVSAPAPAVTSEWRVVGWYRANNIFTVVLQNASKQSRIIPNPPNYKISAAGVEVLLPEGGFATPWTGVDSSHKGILP